MWKGEGWPHSGCDQCCRNPLRICFEKINKDIIAGAGTVDTPSRYQFTDEGIEIGKRYWYYVESISMSGRREKFTPTYQSKPNYPETDD